MGSCTESTARGDADMDDSPSSELIARNARGPMVICLLCCYLDRCVWCGEARLKKEEKRGCSMTDPPLLVTGRSTDPGSLNDVYDE
jgi:hypothetical protein